MASTYIVLADDGRHVSLTRGAKPHLDDQRQAAEALQRQGRGGWLVRMDGDYWAKTFALALSEPHELTPSATSWGDACEAFFLRRRAVVGLSAA